MSTTCLALSSPRTASPHPTVAATRVSPRLVCRNSFSTMHLGEPVAAVTMHQQWRQPSPTYCRTRSTSRSASLEGVCSSPRIAPRMILSAAGSAYSAVSAQSQQQPVVVGPTHGVAAADLADIAAATADCGLRAASASEQPLHESASSSTGLGASLSEATIASIGELPFRRRRWSNDDEQRRCAPTAFVSGAAKAPPQEAVEGVTGKDELSLSNTCLGLQQKLACLITEEGVRSVTRH